MGRARKDRGLAAEWDKGHEWVTGWLWVLGTCISKCRGSGEPALHGGREWEPEPGSIGPTGPVCQHVGRGGWGRPGVTENRAGGRLALLGGGGGTWFRSKAPEVAGAEEVENGTGSFQEERPKVDA